jgi:hypothetical protein
MAPAAAERTEPVHHDHLVQVYRESVDLAEAAATFFAAGFENGEPGVAIATAAHWPLVVERLARRGWSADALAADGLLHVRDAELTLAAIVDESGPSERRFADVVGGLFDDVAGREPGRRVRAFGEMVEVLVRRDEREAADTLEAYWNRLAHERNFTLLCGYRIDVLDSVAQLDLLPRIYRAHAAVVPSADDRRVDDAVRRAVVEVLGESDAEKVYEQAKRQAVKAPASHLVLTWLGAHMPRAAERVLTAARSHAAAA